MADGGVKDKEAAPPLVTERARRVIERGMMVKYRDPLDTEPLAALVVHVHRDALGHPTGRINLHCWDRQGQGWPVYDVDYSAIGEVRHWTDAG